MKKRLKRKIMKEDLLDFLRYKAHTDNKALEFLYNTRTHKICFTEGTDTVWAQSKEKKNPVLAYQIDKNEFKSMYNTYLFYNH